MVVYGYPSDPVRSKGKPSSTVPSALAPFRGPTSPQLKCGLQLDSKLFTFGFYKGRT